MTTLKFPECPGDEPVELELGRVVEQSQILSRAEVGLYHIAYQARCVQINLLKR